LRPTARPTARYVNGDVSGKILKEQAAQSRPRSLSVNRHDDGDFSARPDNRDGFSGVLPRKIGRVPGGLPNQPDSYTVQRGIHCSPIAQKSLWGRCEACWYLIADANASRATINCASGSRW